MTTEHFIAGKDASLESTIGAMEKKLFDAGFRVEERSWLNPVDGVWSVHLADADCPLLYTNGKGASRLAALASALGEFFERLSCNYFWTHYYLGDDFAEADFTHDPKERWFIPDADGEWPEELLTPELRALYDPDRAVHASMLVDLNSGNEERGICALPFTRVSDEQCIWFPVNILANLYVSNGMAAGNTPAEARTQALSEIFERHIKFRIISEGLCLPEVPDEVIERFPRLAHGIAELRAAGFGIRVRDASLGGQYPVMNVTLLHPEDQGCYASFGAHPRFEIALERALVELLQGRSLDALSGFPEPGFDLEEVASPPNLEIHFVDSSGVVAWNFLADEPDFDFCDWNFSDSTQDDYAWLVSAIHAEGYDIHIADFTHLGVYACRIIVPGMSEVYPIDDLEYENNSVGNALRDTLLYLPELEDEECQDLLEALNDSGLADHRPVAALAGLAADPGSFWEDLRIGELKTLLALAIGNGDAIREGCDWIHHFAQIHPERYRVYRCIEALLKLEDEGLDEGCRPAVQELYGSAALQMAEAHLARATRFFDIPAPGEALEGFDLHERLIDAYAKVHRLKAAH